MNKWNAVCNALNIIIILLLLIITICGISAFDTSYSYEIVNQYGENIQMWGAGIYAHDSYFKAPIFIGSDFTILLFIVPLTIITLDMGIISPLIFITYYLAKHEYFIGYALLRMILRVCTAVGIMLPVQTIFQLAAGISIPIPALITKVFIFVLLAVFAVFFDYRLTRQTKFVGELG